MRPSFAEEPRKQCRRVFELLIDLANNDETIDYQDVSSTWEKNKGNCLNVRFRLSNLSDALNNHFEKELEKGKSNLISDQSLRTAIHNLGEDFLGFSGRIRGVRGRGKDGGIWKFVTKDLPSRDKEVLLHYFDEEWQKARARQGLSERTQKERRSRVSIKDTWIVDETFSSSVIEAANGVSYEILKLSCIHQDRIDRAKKYNLEKLSDKEKRQIETLLKRHPKVVAQLEGKKGIPVNRTVFEEKTSAGKYWWVIDQWIEGESLDSLLRGESLPEKNLRKFSRSLLKILHELHAVNIILRDISPQSIIISSSKGQPFVIDFEFAFMVKAESTVSTGNLLPNSYRAPELGMADPRPSRQADLYSWAKVVTAAATGNPEPTDDDLDALQEKLPEVLYQQVERCLDINPEKRPASAKEVIKALPFWY